MKKEGSKRADDFFKNVKVFFKVNGPQSMSFVPPSWLCGPGILNFDQGFSRPHTSCSKSSLTYETLKLQQGIIGQNLTIVQSGDESYQTTPNSLEGLNRRALNADSDKNATNSGFSKVRNGKGKEKNRKNSKNLESSNKSKSQKKNEIKGMVLTQTEQPIR